MSSAKDPGGGDSTKDDKDGNDSDGGSDGRPPAGSYLACGRDGRTSGGTGGLAIGMHLTALAATLTEGARRPGCYASLAMSISRHRS